MKKEKLAEASQTKGTLSVTELAKKAINAGYRVVPIATDGYPMGGFGAGQSYPIDDHRWRSAGAVGVVLDQAVLVDYDGNKADDEGSWIVPVEELPKMLGLDIMPTPVQVGSNGRSLHWLFRLPEGVRAGVDVRQSADGKLTDHLDIKCGNQLMHLKTHKQLNELKAVAQLPVAPSKVVEVLRSSGGDGSYDDAMANLMRGSPLHHSARTIVNRLLAQGKDDIEIWSVFASLRPALEMVRGRERIDQLFSRGIPDLIKSGLEKYPPAPVPFEEEVVEKSVWDDWVYVAHDDCFYNCGKSLAITKQAFKSYMSREDRSVLVGDRVKQIPAPEYAIEHIGVPIVDFKMYAPQFGELFTYKTARYRNTFNPASMPSAESDYPSDFQNHIEMLFPNDHKIITQWMAWVVRNVGRKVQWALLLKGVQGDGKGLITNMMQAALGLQNVHQVTDAELDSNFTGWAAGHCLNVLDEIRLNSHNRHKIMEKLKALITNDTVGVVAKGVNGQTVLNTVNYIMTTNHEDALALDEGDRRYGVFFTKYTDRSELPGIREYYNPLHALVRERPGAVRAWLDDVDLSDFDPMIAPAMTEAKRKMIEKAKPAYVESLEEALALGIEGANKEVFSTKVVNDIIKEYSLGKPLSPTLFGMAAKALGYEKVERLVKWRTVPHRLWQVSGSNLSNDEIRAKLDNNHNFEPE